MTISFPYPVGITLLLEYTAVLAKAVDLDLAVMDYARRPVPARDVGGSA